ncbi:MAG TPA: glycosyltransferase family 2 protein [Candidatus Marinimicrobia bacterium]|jgi:glycosyltransferase involved in cell wall biosynthesis|nr:glycosyltransferase family 2 protein [Candidatus Neomarinimicrobiota bacterium]HJM69698.1 glycosyltransferase family 2 protein [Candidatus Neomarinimicrobiota bacterium]|tara:strand:+ start:10903 stop:11841 length:939 start_codon:yes stop_codon:yes gene_type:complete
MKSISVIIPVYNEVESLRKLHNELSSVLTGNNNYELLFIDDGSSDGSIELLNELANTDDHIKVIQFYRNYGKAAALAEGFKMSTGAYVVTMDADLQDDPAEIPNLIEKLEEGYDLVSGWKKTRHDPWTKRWPSKFFNFVTRLMTGVKIHDFNCGLKIYRQSVVKTVEIYGGRHRYIPALAGQKKFKVSEIIVNHRARKFGVTKYGGVRLFHGFFDLLTILFLNRYTQQPLHLFGMIGIIFSTVGFGVEVYVLYLKYGLMEPFQKHIALLVFGVMMIVIGIQFISMGLLGELMARSQQSKEDRVKQIIDHQTD